MVHITMLLIADVHTVTAVAAEFKVFRVQIQNEVKWII